jgi:signal transduction histidine kinase
MENKDMVFKEYERVKGTKQKGTGLGLPLVKKLVELNNGKIWFESELDKGTTFYILLQKYKNI